MINLKYYETTKLIEVFMANIKNISKIAEKWMRQSSVSEQSYTEGIQSPRSDWATSTSEANDSYKKGIQASIAKDSFLKGVKRAGTSKWQTQALNKGPARWSDGINKSGSSYADGFQPYLEVISRTQLPKRGPKGDPSNIQRVSVMAKAMHDEKVKRQG